MSNILRSASLEKQAQKLVLKRSDDAQLNPSAKSKNTLEDLQPDMHFSSGATTASQQKLNQSSHASSVSMTGEELGTLPSGAKAAGDAIVNETNSFHKLNQTVENSAQHQMQNNGSDMQGIAAEDIQKSLQSTEDKGYEKGLKRGEIEGFEKGKKDGHAVGYDAGYEEGKKAAMSAGEDAAEKLIEVITNLQQQWSQAFNNSQSHLVAIAYAAVVKILGKHFTDETLVKDMVAGVLQEYSDQQILVIKVSAKDYETIKSSDIDLGSISIKSDEKVRLGGCLIETLAGTIDARFDIQLENLKQLLVNEHALRQEQTVTP